MSSTRVEILSIVDCPNAGIARARVHEALALEARVAQIVELVVDTIDDARELRFLGSPSVRVNGQDIEPSARIREDYALACRTYHVGSDLSGAPPLALIRDAIRHSV